MDKSSFLNSIALITVFVMLLLAFFLLTVHRKNKLPNILFACFLLLTAFDLSGFFSYRYFDISLDFDIFRMTTSILIMPFFYLYVKSVCFSDFRLSGKHLVHAITFFASNLLFAPRVYLGTEIEKNQFLAHFEKTTEVRIFHVLSEVQYIFYIVLIFILLNKYKKIYLENYTNSQNSSYKWLFQMTVFFLVAHCIFIFKSLLKYTDYQELFDWTNVIIGIVAMIISCWFVLKALNNPELFKGVDSEMVLVNEAVHPKINIAKSEKTVLINSQIESLRKYVSEHELYLNPSLTIQEVSQNVGIPVRDLSLLINQQMNQHFFDFINEFRIEKAMQILKDESKTKLTVLEILYEVGFNSKSSFNTAFKKHTNMTPTEFRKS